MATVFSRIAGAGFRFDAVARAKDYSKKGGQLKASLEADLKNDFDPNAVKVLCEVEGEILHLGYVPREHSAKARRALAEGRIISVEIVRIGYKGGGSRAAWGQMKIEVKPPAPGTEAPSYFVPNTYGNSTPPADSTIAAEEGATIKNPAGAMTDDPPPTEPPPDEEAPKKRSKKSKK
jgi:hypothetical protein